jgi:uncharacterized membrane protein (DUF441 family)
MESLISTKKCILRGLSWGLFMFLAMAILLPLAKGDQLTIAGLLKEFVIWLFLGLAYGFILHQIEKPKTK